eukprot:TRINITY_DN6025_c0_g2_i1.p1 TRINITY_DN6025_c0_g2~~TRINITY_DN6025_c0_g2_i1.p1  ORF type:complete len:168 (-),score=31.47 TRINITY_DN6025_c0_g2_i1:116-619(-)
MILINKVKYISPEESEDEISQIVEPDSGRSEETLEAIEKGDKIDVRTLDTIENSDSISHISSSESLDSFSSSEEDQTITKDKKSSSESSDDLDNRTEAEIELENASRCSKYEAPEHDFKEGDRVWARWKLGDTYRGTIGGFNVNGTARIQFDDGDEEDHQLIEYIQI